MKTFLWTSLVVIVVGLSLLGGNYTWNLKIDNRIEKAMARSFLGFTNPQGKNNNGLILTSVATSTLTTAQVCTNSFLSIAPATTTPTITTPGTSTMFLSCLPNVGAYWDVNYLAVNTSTIIAAGAGGTIINSSASTVAANKGAVLRFVRDTTLTYKLFIINVLN